MHSYVGIEAGSSVWDSCTWCLQEYGVYALQLHQNFVSLV